MPAREMTLIKDMKSGKKRDNSPLTKAEVNQIVLLLKRGYKARDVNALTGVSLPIISSILAGKHRYRQTPIIQPEVEQTISPRRHIVNSNIAHKELARWLFVTYVERGDRVLLEVEYKDGQLPSPFWPNSSNTIMQGRTCFRQYSIKKLLCAYVEESYVDNVNSGIMTELVVVMDDVDKRVDKVFSSRFIVKVKLEDLFLDKFDSNRLILSPHLNEVQMEKEST